MKNLASSRFVLLVGMTLTIGFTAIQSAIAAPTVGTTMAPVTIEGENGGRTDGKAWTSDVIKGKVWTLFYVDPDHRDINGDLETALSANDFPLEKYGSIAVINMDATWLPNTFLESALADKQEKYPKTMYVKDLKKVLVGSWKMTDDQYDVLLFDKTGKVLLSFEGVLSKEQIKTLIDTIKLHLDDPAA